MIIRIMHEGQYRIDGRVLEEINAIDNQLVEAVTSSDQAKYESLLAQITSLIKGKGIEVPASEIVPSDAILPDVDTTLEEAQQYFKGEGIIPD